MTILSYVLSMTYRNSFIYIKHNTYNRYKVFQGRIWKKSLKFFCPGVKMMKQKDTSKTKRQFYFKHMFVSSNYQNLGVS